MSEKIASGAWRRKSRRSFLTAWAAGVLGVLGVLGGAWVVTRPEEQGLHWPLRAMHLPAPLILPWTLKPVSSAESGTEVLPDGRMKFWIRHDVLRGVTPRMLDWWFRNMEGDVEIGGQRLPRYRVWHPNDHVSLRYAKRLPDGSIGPGAVFHIQEVLGRNLNYQVDTLTRVEKLDEEGFVHIPSVHGLELARMEYAFTRVKDGTLYENGLILGKPGLVGTLLRKAVLPWVFPPAQGTAWIRHNIEEVGMFENFLPTLYRQHTGKVD